MTSTRNDVVVTGAFGNIRSRDVRFLDEASKRGPVTVLLLPEEPRRPNTGEQSILPLAERLYLLQAIRYVNCVIPAEGPSPIDAIPLADGVDAAVWVDTVCSANDARHAWCDRRGIDYVVLPDEQLAGFPAESSCGGATVQGASKPPSESEPLRRKKVVVTGCYDWLHSGHVRFFEEVSAYGDLYVVVGHDANIRLLKGPGHPLLPQAERRYLVGAIRFVTQALISSGDGWVDADPEIQRIKPDIYAVNEDGDKGGKREYCAQHGIAYLVLKRIPAPGLPRRSSTELRGF